MEAHGADRTALEQARDALAQSRAARAQRTRAAALSQAELASLERARADDDPDVVAARREHERRLRELAETRAAVADAHDEVAARLGAWLAPDAVGDVERLSAAYPIVLLPVRLETRFDRPPGGPPELRVRLYPDTVAADAHDPRLTAEERDAGAAYWRRGWTDEPAAWRDLVRAYPASRAAWIARATEPLNLAERPQGEPVLPDVELRAQSWDRPPEAAVLPDRWIVIASRDGAEDRRALSAPVRDPLAVGFDPHVPPEEGVNVAGGELRLDSELAWTVDFERAEEAGMAVRLVLAPEDAERGFDRLLAVGVKGSLDPEATRTALERLLDAQRYTGGLAFVRQGTPTNNSERESSPVPPPDPDGARSFAIERGEPLDAEAGDGALAMRALGLARATVAHVEGSNRTEQVAARAMNQALWPATWGYFLRHLMAPHVGDDAIAQTREHFAEHVRGRGPLPAFRVRSQPYALLPVTSLSHWEPGAGATGLERELPVLLRRLRPVWRARIPDVPRVGRTTDPDADLLATLGMDAATREIRVRRVHGRDFRHNLLAFLDLDAAVFEARQDAIARPAMALIGQPSWRPRILRMDFADEPGRFRWPLVAPGPPQEDAGLEAAIGFDYVAWLRSASLDDLRAERMPNGRQVPTALMYRLLRHARLTELARVAIDLHVTHGSAPATERHERELVGIPSAAPERPTIWERLRQPIPALTGAVAIGDFLADHPAAPDAGSLKDLDADLRALEGLPTAELERLFTEVLDLCAHRLDAWMTSLASRRLAAMRRANPSGAHVGAYGWVEDLRPAPVGAFVPTTLADGRAARLAVGGAGHVHAPSLSHAAAAAVLRNGHLRRGAAAATDLSSARVRTALSLLDAVRDGEPLGAVLGYQFERGLHEGHQPLMLDRVIEPLRRRFPLVANKAGVDEGPPEAVAARAVVDGLALHTAWKAGEVDAGDAALFGGAAPSAAERAAVAAELRRLDETIDAVTDLLTAESVYQVVNGNPSGANASLDAMAKGTRPPDPAVAHGPRAGVALTHRVAVVLGGGADAPAGWDGPPTPRARAEPAVDAWVGRLLGDPAAVRCRARLADGSEVVVALRDLRLRPLDVIALAEGAAAELEARVRDTALASAAPGAEVAELVFEPDPTWDRATIRSVPDALELARTAGQLLAVARPLAAVDLAPPGAPAAEPDADDAAEAMERAAAARAALAEVGRKLAAALEAGDPADEQLRSASLYGIAGGYPAAASSAEPAAVLTEIERRVAAAQAADDAVGVARAVFGRAFALLPGFAPPAPDELRLALAKGPSLAGDTRAPRAWLHQAARTRRALRHWRRLALLAGAVGTDEGTLDVAQLPHGAASRWAALPFAEGDAPPRGLVSLVLHRVAAPDPAERWVGLLVDEFTETIPDASAATGVAFHVETPGVEAPQAVLIAVPPRDRPTWDLESLASTLEETLEAAKLRAVDGELLGMLGQLAPVVYVSTNTSDDTISTDLQPALEADEHLVAEQI